MRPLLRNPLTKNLLVILLLALSPLIILPTNASEDNRLILGLYDSKEDPLRLSPIHKQLGLPFNRLGMKVEYHDVQEKKFPDATKYRAIAIWFTDEKMPRAEVYLKWLADASKNGVRLLAFNGFGADLDEDGTEVKPALKELPYRMLGLNLGTIGDFYNPFKIKLVEDNPKNFSFEVNTPNPKPVYRDIRIIDDSVTPWLSIERTDIKDSLALVIGTGAKGGFIADSNFAVRYYQSPVWQTKWDLNPFKFLEATLGLKQNLRPDTTTAFGARSAFSHIDADGALNLTLDIKDGQRPATEVLLEQVLKEYPLPVTVGFIAYETTKESSTGNKFIKLFKEILALPNTQAAAHGYTHPMIWAEGTLGIRGPVGYKFDPVQETVGAIDIIQQEICPPRKKAELFLWTGDCLATHPTLQALENRGFYNMNGGDPRLDGLYSGLCNIPALTRPVGNLSQTYAAACNEYLYTNGWTENFSGYENVLQTFKNTANPRYLPVNIYYHIYLCERQAGLDSLLKVYNWAMKESLCWLTALEYCKVVDGFFSARTGRTASDGYYIENYEGLHTVRLDNELRHVDIASASNIAGYNHTNGSLYISLIPGTRAEFSLVSNEGRDLYIKSSTSLLRNIQISSNQITAEIRLYALGTITLGGLGAKKLRVMIDGKEVPQNNQATAEIPSGLGEWVNIGIVKE